MSIQKLKKKKLFLVFHGRFPSEKAASIFVAKSAEAFAEQGIQVTLIVPRRRRVSTDDPYQYYNIKNNFQIIYIPTIDLFGVPLLSKIAFYVSLITFSKLSFFYLLFTAKKNDIIYSNETLPLLLASLRFPQTFYEVHDFPEKKKIFYGLLFSRIKWILVTNKWKLKKIEEEFKQAKGKTFLERNAVEIEEFDINVTKENARKKLGLPLDKKIVMYTGHLYSWKGVDTLAQAARNLPEDIRVIFVGGTEGDIVRFKNTYSEILTVMIVGSRPHKEIPLWQKAADVLVLPNTAKEDISKYYTSPMKLFEYMASKRPIIASNIPSITEILNGENAILVEPDNEKSFTDGIIKVLRDYKLSEHIAAQAFKDVSLHSWQARAKRIIRYIFVK